MKKLTALLLLAIIFSASFLAAEISVVPYGAAQTVSGSCFLLDADGEKILIDHGLFMDNDGENKEINDMPEELIETKALFLTHAHLDHSGRIPLLVNKGFKGTIYSTAATKELALLLFRERNGFEIIERKWFWSQTQMEKAQNKNVTAVAHWDKGCKENIKNIEYSSAFVNLGDLCEIYNVKFLACKNCSAKETVEIEKLFKVINYDEENVFSEKLKFKFIRAGHIPGSASIVFTVNLASAAAAMSGSDAAIRKKIIFSGDLGSGYSRLNGEFSIPEKADFIFMESTYADDKAKFDFTAYDAFQDDLAKAVAGGKTVWIPALSFNRTQKVLYELRLMQKNGKLPKNFPVHSVSPSANKITELYQKELADNKKGYWFTEDIYKEGSIIPEKASIKRDIKFDKPLIVVSSSGDLERGASARIAPSLLPRKDVEIMIVNYVSPKSAAGMLLAGRGKVKGIKSNAGIKKYDIFSDHPDFGMLQKWLSNQSNDAAIYIIHSEKRNAAKMESLLKKKGRTNVSKTAYKEKIVLQ
ncbi:MAG: MBL fold metallo-hydrolase [Endomicrobia bacterium]|nr:MBL fold metallo-hydrolase [Endomicrobiia bacterium]